MHKSNHFQTRVQNTMQYYLAFCLFIWHQIHVKEETLNERKIRTTLSLSPPLHKHQRSGECYGWHEAA